ncbi:mevalonate kinase [Companilactobacillus allii]|uniref:Mevalonate kinase n=1 Tax=Companilactobacillus allii TaxID=1847728 RepID=A0A1P8Q4N8_9LACO|nr:mevalonate kinase [Companilactobacillus allii]APX72807.1 mevalonate kinase [Companilactobacillus allii]USQ67596.1 mevalonate kinase [Companilactobacillus allii]
MLKGIGKSHGKTIIMGEHAVVYGYPAIAIPLVSIPVIVRIKVNPESTLSSKYFVGKLSNLPDSLSGVKYLINLLDEKLNTEHINYAISIDSSLPIERGLGSSAAIGSALTRAFFDFFDKPLDDDTLIHYVNKSETVTHGKASGLDALTVISDFPVNYSKKEQVNYFNFNSDGFLVIADSGVKGKTKETVSDVKKMYDKDPHYIGEILKQLGQCTKQTKMALNDNHLKTLGKIFNTANNLLSELNLSIPKTDKLIQSANNSGALGSKITGGGRGGCIICLARNLTNAEMIQRSLIKSGAEQTWLQPLSIYSEEPDID